MPRRGDAEDAYLRTELQTMRVRRSADIPRVARKWAMLPRNRRTSLPHHMRRRKRNFFGLRFNPYGSEGLEISNNVLTLSKLRLAGYSVFHGYKTGSVIQVVARVARVRIFSFNNC